MFGLRQCRRGWLLLVLLRLVLLLLLMVLLLLLLVLLLLLLVLLMLLLLLRLLVLLLLLQVRLVLLLLLWLWWWSRWPLLRLLVLGSLRSPGPLNLGVHEAGSGVNISVGRRGISPNRIRALRPRNVLSTSDLGIGSRSRGLYWWDPPRWTWCSSVGSPGRRRRRQR